MLNTAETDLQATLRQCFGIERTTALHDHLHHIMTGNKSDESEITCIAVLEFSEGLLRKLADQPGLRVIVRRKLKAVLPSSVYPGGNRTEYTNTRIRILG